MFKSLLSSKILSVTLISLLAGLLILWRMPSFKAQVKDVETGKPEIYAPVRKIKSPQYDNREQVLRSYLAKYNSPLENSAGDFIEAADKNSLDWKLVPSIAGVESTFGKHVPGGLEPGFTSYNGWGWGVYGTNAIYFDSWREAIFTISEGLKTRYVDRGLTDPYSMNKVYAASPSWGWKVAYFLSDLERFSQNYSQNRPSTAAVDLTYAPAGESGKLAHFPKLLAFNH